MTIKISVLEVQIDRVSNEKMALQTYAGTRISEGKDRHLFAFFAPFSIILGLHYLVDI